MASTLWTLLASGAINADISARSGVIAIVIALSVVLGFAAGLAIHALPRVREALDPFFATYYAVPIFIFYPVLIAIFGLSLMPIVLIGVATAIVAMIIATLNGLDRVPRVLTKVARVHRLGRIKTAVTLQLPAAAPYLFTGVKLAVSLRLHRGRCRRVHSLARRARPRHRRRLRRLQQSPHVCAHSLPSDHRDALQFGAARPRHALGRAAHRRPSMTATRRATDTFIIVLVMLVVWQALHQIAGETALPAPMPTLSYLVHNVATRRFAENAATTAVELVYALVLAYGIGLAIGVWMGAHRLSGAVGEPILVALYSLPKIVALSGGAAHLRPRHFRQGDVWRHARHPAGGPAHHGCDPRHPTGLSARGAHAAPVAGETIASVLLPAALPEVFTGLRIGFSVTLLGVLLGEMFASKQGLGSMIMTDM